MLTVSLWQSGRISASHTGGSGLEHRSNPFLKQYFLSLNSLNSVKAFRENSNTYQIYLHKTLLLLLLQDKLNYPDILLLDNY